MEHKDFALLITILLMTIYYPCYKVHAMEQVENINILDEAPETTNNNPDITSEFGEDNTFLNEEGQAEPNNFIVSNLEEFFEATSNKIANVTFASNITIPAGENMILGGSDGELINIHTQEYSIVVEGTLFLNSNTLITGEGINVPIIEVASTGTLAIYGSDYDSAPTVTATGENGISIFLKSESRYFRSSSSFLKLYAPYGTGLQSEIPLSLDRHFITARHGVVSTKDVSILLCKISAEIKAINSPSVYIDTSEVSPWENEYGKQVQRKISKYKSKKTIFLLGDTITETQALIYRITPILSAEGVKDIAVDMNFMFDLSRVAIDMEGTYYVPPLDGEWAMLCGFIQPDEMFYPVYVNNLHIPVHIESFLFFGTANLSYRFLGNTDKLILWRSDDEGKTWQNAMGSIDFDYVESDTRLELLLNEEDHPVWLMWEILGIGKSEILQIDWQEGEVIDNPGGDRTGIDRDESTPPPLQKEQIIPSLDDVQRIPSYYDEQKTPLSEVEQTAPLFNKRQTITRVINEQTTSTVYDEQIISLPTNLPDTELPDMALVSKMDDFSMVNESSSVSTPKPQINKAPTLLERTDETIITISGQQLLVMMEANPNYVTFIQFDMWVSIPTQYLLELPIVSTDTFFVKLEKLDESSFYVEFLLNQKKLEKSFEVPFLISIPWDGDTVSCIFENSMETVATLKDEKAIFSLTHMGTYYLSLLEPSIPVFGSTQEVLPSDTYSDNTKPEISVIYAKEDIKPYKDSFKPVAVAFCFGFLGVAAYVLFSWKKRLRCINEKRN